MDKDVIRIIIVLMGLLIVAGLMIWSFLKHESARKEFDDFESSTSDNDHHSPISEINSPKTSSVVTKNSPQFKDVRLNEHELEEHPQTPAIFKSEQPLDPISSSSQNFETLSLPDVLQFFVVAPTEEGFSGVDLIDALDDADLEYGNLQIFERLDHNRLVDFGVANMVKPGIFPQHDLTSFHTPGIVFFMQPKAVDNPVVVFEDFTRTIDMVAIALGGDILDHNRELLTQQTIQNIRHSL